MCCICVICHYIVVVVDVLVLVDVDVVVLVEVLDDVVDVDVVILVEVDVVVHVPAPIQLLPDQKYQQSAVVSKYSSPTSGLVGGEDSVLTLPVIFAICVPVCAVIRLLLLY